MTRVLRASLFASSLVASSILAPLAAQPPTAPPPEPPSRMTLDGKEVKEPSPSPIPDDVDPHTTASGLTYCVLKAGGEGTAPRLGDRVRVHYTGWLTDGTVFDSSRTRGEPAEFALGQVIEGWNEGLQLVTPGARIKLTIPPRLGYGAPGQPPVIPANATLVFDIELLAVTARAPEFHAVKADATKSDSGLRWEALAEGSGEPPKPGDPVQLAFTVWNTEGKLVYCSSTMDGPAYSSAASTRWKFMSEALPMMKPGARWACEVPAQLAFGDRAVNPDLPAGATSVWMMELVRVMTPPAFAMPKGDALTKTPSGLAYQVLRTGEGAAPKMGESVTVHYSGWLTDGTPFDSSYEHGEPATFTLGQVIPGWREGLQLMQPGAVYVFVIPPDLAYGARGSGPKIGPNATLVFHVELLRVAQ